MMSLYEHKYCPRCSHAFECKVGNITQCQCYGVPFTPEERTYIDKLFTDCVCRTCLLELKNDFAQERFAFIGQLKKHR